MLGPADGRYLVRGVEGSDELEVVSFTTLGAPPRRTVRGRRPRRAEAGAHEPEPVAVSRASAISASPFDGTQDAERWLERCRKDGGEREVEQALRLINRAVHAHRLAAGDHYVNEVSRGQAQSVRIGYGTGDQLVHGRWSAAYRLPPERGRVRRRQLLEPQQELAGMLAGRSREYASEDLALRARLDLEHGRLLQALLQLRAAFAALEAEIPGSERDEHVRALLAKGSVSQEEVADVLSELERLLRRRRLGASH